MKLPTATIAEHSPRAADWRRVYGGLEVPIRSPRPVRTQDGRLFYHVRLEDLTADQLERAIAHAAERFGLPVDEVRANLEDPTHGLPILAEDVTVMFDMRHVL